MTQTCRFALLADPGCAMIIRSRRVKRGFAMPLSEEEQRILQDIERSFYESDPAFARAVGESAPYLHAGRNARFAAAGFVASLAVLLATFTNAPLMGLVGFVGMVVCAAIFVRNVRRMIVNKQSEVSAGGRAGEWRDGIRDRFWND